MGSIGVFDGKFVAKGLTEDILGIHNDKVERGEHAGIFSPEAKFTRTERRLMTASLSKFYSRFVDKVAAARGRSFEEIDRIAQGRVWIGEANIETGLVDSFGSLDEAFEAAVFKAGLDQEKGYKWKVYPKPKDFLTELQAKTNIMARSPIDHLKAGLEMWLGQPQMMALFPYHIEMR